MLAAIAGVVGLGNLWRFPYMAGRHGGGSFLLAYLVCLIAVSIPLAALESAAGSLGRRSPVGALRRAAGRPGAAIGWAIIVMTVAILSYYFVVSGWTLGYALDAFGGNLRPFAEFTGGLTSLWFLLAVGGIVLAVLVVGMSAVERASLYLVPLLVLIVAGLTVWAQTLDGAAEARSFYFGLDTDRLLDPATWRAAAGQSFYSIGVGQGVLLAYGSFVPAGTNLLRSTAIIAATNATVSIVAGLMVFSVVFTFGIEPTAGSELSFTAFPRAFAELPGGAALAVAFFAVLFLAAFTSCLGSSVVALSAVRDELGCGSRFAALITVAAIVGLGIPSALSFTDVGLTVGGQPVLDRVDQVTGSGVIVVLGLVGAAVLAWSLPRRRLVGAFNSGELRAGSVVMGPDGVISWARVLPVVTSLLFVIGTFL